MRREIENGSFGWTKVWLVPNSTVKIIASTALLFSGRKFRKMSNLNCQPGDEGEFHPIRKGN